MFSLTTPVSVVKTRRVSTADTATARLLLLLMMGMVVLVVMLLMLVVIAEC